jgi:iron complex outermembrane receptor protein
VCLALPLAFWLAAAPAPVWSQEADGAPGGSGTGPRPGVEEIMVIGEVLETSTQAESEAITTFDQSELDSLGIANVDSLALNTPSLHVGQVGQQAVITLRGIGLENLTSIGEAGVGFQVDGIHLARPAGSNAAFFDLENVSVDRGPVGTRGGRQTNGGRISLWSAKPTEEPDFFGDVAFGNFDSQEYRTVLNLPILDEYLMTRTSAIYNRHRGYTDLGVRGANAKDIGDQDDFAGRFQLRSLFLDQRLQMRVIAGHSYQKGNGPGLKLIGPPSSRTNNTIGFYQDAETRNGFDFSSISVACPAPPDPSLFVRDEVCVTDDVFESFSELVPNRDNEQNNVTATLTWDLPFFEDTAFSDLTFGIVGGWHQNIEDSISDFDGTNIPEQLFDLRRNSKQKSLEVYLERPDIGLWDFRAGFHFFEERIKTDLCFDTDGGVASFADLDYSGRIGSDSLAAYGEFGLRPIDTLRIFGGLRYTRDDKKADEFLGRFRNFRPEEDPDNINNDGPIADQTFVEEGECGRFFRDLALIPNDPVTIDAAGLADPRLDPVNPVYDPVLAGELQAAQDAGNAIVFTLSDRGQTDPNGFSSCCTIQGPNTTDLPEVSDVFQGLTPMLGFEWQASDSSTIGFSATRGFKPGGFPLAFDPELFSNLGIQYDSEFVWEFELSSKNELFDGLVTLNLTGFWTEYDPFQICQFNGPTFICRSDGSATIRGVELEWKASPFEGLQLNGHFNFTDTRVNNFQIVDPTIRACLQPSPPCPSLGSPPSVLPQPLPSDVSGNSLPKAPSWAGSFGIQYDLDMGRWGIFTPRFQTQFQGETFFRVFNLDQFAQEEYIKFDAKLNWLSEDGRFFGELFVVNFTDEEVLNSLIVGSAFTGGQVLGQYQPPRLYGVKLGIRTLGDLMPELW